LFHRFSVNKISACDFVMQLNSSKITATVFALAYLGLIVYLGLTNARLGLSQYLSFRADIENDFEKAKSAIEFYPSNPAAHRIDGFLSLQNGDYRSAAEKLKQTIKLQPNDYVLWLRLGDASGNLNDFETAFASYQKAIELAPNYAHPKWNAGLIRLKLGKIEEAFEYLREAANVNSEYYPDLLRLAHEKFPGDADAIERAVSPKKTETKKQLAHFFIRHKLLSADSRKFLLSDELNKTQKNEFISTLIKDGEFSLARLIWQSAHGKPNESDSLIINGDFESEINSSEIGFSWQPGNQDSTFLLALDGENAFSNKFSLQISFNGNHASSEAFISQLCLAQPGSGYELSFAARTEKLVAGGLPTVLIKDAKTDAILGKPIFISEKVINWEIFKIRFSAGNKTEAIKIEVRRENCSSNSCPIFGNLWLDNFQIKLVPK
jgi:hypothetical protein